MSEPGWAGRQAKQADNIARRSRQQTSVAEKNREIQ